MSTCQDAIQKYDVIEPFSNYVDQAVRSNPWRSDVLPFSILVKNCLNLFKFLSSDT